MWFYEVAHQPQGPVEIDAIRELLASGQINAATLVWREGMPDWKPLQQTELAELWKTVSSNVAQTIVQPTVQYEQSTHRMKSNSLKNLFVWWLVLQSIALVYFALNYFLPNDSIKRTISCVLELPIMTTVILQLILLFKFWEVVQDGFARTSPAKAIGFLFIPFFNLYWNFPAQFGLSKDLNRYSRQHFENLDEKGIKTSHPILALITIICSYLVTGYFTYFFIRIFSLAFASRGNTATYDLAIKAMSQQMTIISLVMLMIQILFIIDLYRTASSILEAEEAQ
jgi:hypothetical protein